MTHGSLFSGIGGFDLAAEWIGWENLFHCEWNSFGQKVLKHYWPNAESFNDITKTNFTKYANRIDVLTGGFPCQPYSLAGKRKGKEDNRHLWPEMLRAIREIQPHWVIGENVFGLVNWSGGLVFEEVQTDLENEGYEVWPVILPACAKNAPHRRDRIWFIAHRNSNEREKRRTGFNGREECIREGSEVRATTSANVKGGTTTNAKSEQSERVQFEQREFSEQGEGELGRNGGEVGDGGDATNAIGSGRQQNDGQRIRKSNVNDKINTPGNWQDFPTQSPICGGDDGLPRELDGITFPKWREESIKAYGNAIVPQVAFEIFKTIEKYELTKITS